MATRNHRKPSRQVKTLGTLVLSMTLGTALLNWVHDLTPAKSSATTLRATSTRRLWDRIVVETISTRSLRPDGSVRSFYHLHVDREGQVQESAAWEREQRDPKQPGAIRIVVSVDRNDPDLTPRQWKRLTSVVAHLQSVHQITRDRITARDGTDGSADAGRLNTMLRTR